MAFKMKTPYFNYDINKGSHDHPHKMYSTPTKKYAPGQAAAVHAAKAEKKGK